MGVARIKTATGWEDLTGPEGPPGRDGGEYELAFAQITSPVLITATTEATAQTIITAPAIVMDGLTTIILEMFNHYLAPPASQNMTLWLFQDGVSLGRIYYSPNASGAPQPKARLTPAVGSRTYSIRGSVSGGTGTVSAGAGGAGVDRPLTLRIKRVLQVPSLIPVVSSLPANPYDGQEIYFLADATDGVIWHLRYRAASPHATYKWEFVGGAPLRAITAAAEGTPSPAAWVDLATVGPSITLPLKGEYEVWGDTGQIYINTAKNTGAIGYKLGAAAAIAAGSMWSEVAAFQWCITGRPWLYDVAAASTVVKMQYYSNVGSVSYQDRRLFARPLRVG